MVGETDQSAWNNPRGTYRDMLRTNFRRRLALYASPGAPAFPQQFSACAGFEYTFGDGVASPLPPFPSLQQIRPMIETVPLATAAEAYGRMMRNEARFRIVLVT